MTDEEDKGMRTIENILKELSNKLLFLSKHNELEISFSLKKEVKFPFHINMDDFKLLYKSESSNNLNYMYI